MTVVGQPQVVYTYDNADRLTSETYPNTNKIKYGYNVDSELTTELGGRVWFCALPHIRNRLATVPVKPSSFRQGSEQAA
jgi:YD repeat-containing protein